MYKDTASIYINDLCNQGTLMGSSANSLKI